MDIDQLRAALAWITACLREIHQAALERGTDIADAAARCAAQALTTDEQTRWDEGQAEVERLTTLIERAEFIERAAARPGGTENGDGARGAPNLNLNRGGDPFDLSEMRFSPFEDGRAQARTLRDRAMTALDRVDFHEDAHRDRVEQLLRTRDRQGALAAHVLVTGSDAYGEAFAKLVTGRGDELTNEERRAVAVARAMSLTNANGGYAVPFLLDPTIILTNDGTINELRQISTVKQIIVKTWNGVSSAGVTAAYAAEATESSDNAPTLAQPSIPAQKAQAFVPFSIEAEEDITNLAADIAMLFGDAKDRLEATKFTVGAGSGSSEPKGIVTAVAAVTASRVAATTNDAFGKEDVYALLGAVPARHRKNARWLANNLTYLKIRQFDTNGGSAFWTDLNGDNPGTLLGKPRHEAEDMDGVIGSGNDDILLCGDFSKFVIVDRIGLSVEYVPHLFGSNGRPTGQRGWYAHWRSGSDVVDVNAFRIARI